MSTWQRTAAVGVLFMLASMAEAGLYYSGEVFAELPSQWRGFLLDQRTLRQIAVPETPKTPASPARVRYLEEREKLEKKVATGHLSAEESADLGALYVRSGEPSKAVAVLRPAQQRHPNDLR